MFVGKNCASDVNLDEQSANLLILPTIASHQPYLALLKIAHPFGLVEVHHLTLLNMLTTTVGLNHVVIKVVNFHLHYPH